MQILMPVYPGFGLTVADPALAVTLWDGRSDPPAEASDAEMWVPPFAPVDHVAVLSQLPALRLVQLLTAGHDHVPPLDAVTLCSAAGLHDGAVAEWALAAILAQQRALVAFIADQPRGELARVHSGTLVQKTVMIVGYGGIGQAIERRLAGFEADVVAVASRSRPGVHGVDELAALLPRADVVVLAVPLSEATRGLLGANELALLPDGALVVNLSRGEVLDQDALAAELIAGRLRAALDVSVPDPLPAGHPMRTLPGLLYTPHASAVTTAMFPRLSALITEQAQRLASGAPLVNVVSGSDQSGHAGSETGG